MAEKKKKLGEAEMVRAAAIGDVAAVEAALAAGTKADARDPYGNTALMYASARGHLKVIQALREAGADPELENRWHLTAHDWAEWPENTDDVRRSLYG